MRRWFLISLLVAACVLAALGDKSYADTPVPEKETAIARSYVEKLRLGEFDEIARAADPSLALGQNHALLKALSEHFPRPEPKSIKIKNSRVIVIASQPKRFRVVFEYEFARSSVLADIVLKKAGRKLAIEALSVLELPYAVKETLTGKEYVSVDNNFALTDRSTTHYVFLAAAVLFAFISIVTVIIALFTPIPRFKWLWILFILVGFGTASLNWTTGQVTLDALSVNILSAGIWRENTGPWILKIGYPLGVMLFWFKRDGWLDARKL